jgi:copper homeostasis protein
MIEIIATTLEDVKRIEACDGIDVTFHRAIDELSNPEAGMEFHNIKEVMKNTKVPQYHFGTAVRYGKSAFGDVDEEKLRLLIDTMSEVIL